MQVVQEYRSNHDDARLLGLTSPAHRHTGGVEGGLRHRQLLRGQQPSQITTKDGAASTWSSIPPLVSLPADGDTDTFGGRSLPRVTLRASSGGGSKGGAPLGAGSLPGSTTDESTATLGVMAKPPIRSHRRKPVMLSKAPRMDPVAWFGVSHEGDTTITSAKNR